MQLKYTCEGKGGLYEVVGVTTGAGLSKGESVVVYRDVASGRLYHRTPSDFDNRMRAVVEKTGDL